MGFFCIYPQATLAFLADSFVAGLGNERDIKIQLNDFRDKTRGWMNGCMDVWTDGQKEIANTHNELIFMHFIQRIHNV